ncbi:MAG: hypothetical protein LLF76_10035 [Planctomycetaceae bacterium]|nr:hypothetical protein [Planctomycetaceae bacterium]
MQFPWLRAAALLCVFGFVSVFVFRLSETGGPESRRSCMAALVTCLAAGMLAAYPIGRAWGHGQLYIVLAAMLGSVIRLLIGAAGLAIIAVFTQLNKSWCVFYIGVYYVLFLLIDGVFAAWMLRHSEPKPFKEEQRVDRKWSDMAG